MKINKKAWHYKVWLWTHSVMDAAKYAPEQTDLCSYVQRIFWLTPWCVFWMLVMMLGYIIATPIVFLFGRRPHNIFFPLNKDKKLWLAYPGLKVWGEVRVHPWVIAVPAAIIYGEYRWFHSHWPSAVIVQGLVLFFLGMAMLYGWYDTSDTKYVVKAWVSAKKKGICPLVKFEE